MIVINALTTHRQWHEKTFGHGLARDLEWVQAQQADFGGVYFHRLFDLALCIFRLLVWVRLGLRLEFGQPDWKAEREGSAG